MEKNSCELCALCRSIRGSKTLLPKTGRKNRWEQDGQRPGLPLPPLLQGKRSVPDESILYRWFRLRCIEVNSDMIRINFFDCKHSEIPLAMDFFRRIAQNYVEEPSRLRLTLINSRATYSILVPSLAVVCRRLRPDES